MAILNSGVVSSPRRAAAATVLTVVMKLPLLLLLPLQLLLLRPASAGGVAAPSSSVILTAAAGAAALPPPRYNVTGAADPATAISASTTTTITITAPSCAASDTALTQLCGTLCRSLGGPCPVSVNTTAAGDWPTQATYMSALVDALADPTATCLNTSLARELVQWLDVTNTTTSSWWNTWLVFQVQYYDMPRVPGARIESAATLGRKCWAFSYVCHLLAALFVACMSHNSLAGQAISGCAVCAVPCKTLLTESSVQQ
jgi:hypothetical protein